MAARMSGCSRDSNSRRKVSSANARSRGHARSSVASGASADWPNRETTAAYPAAPGRDNLCATSSASSTSAPRVEKRAPTADLPLPMPPVSPTIRDTSVQVSLEDRSAEEHGDGAGNRKVGTEGQGDFVVAALEDQ